MIRIELPVLVSKLNPISKQILEECAATCMNEQYAEITVPNLLLSFLSSPLNDIRIILSEASIDVDELKTLLKENSEQTRLLDVQQNYPVFSPLLVELLQDSWLTASTEFNLNTLRSGIILYVLLGSVYRYLPNQAAKILISINRELLKQDFVAKLINSAETENTTYSKESSRVGTKSDSLLAMYAQNVTELARQGKIDPVLCRDKEIDLMIDILSRRRKNNPIVVGEAGVGKSALIEGLALRIVSENVPESMLNTELMNLDLGALQAGAAVKGEFEKRFKGIMKEVNESIKPIILFIDEAHTLIGAGNQSGGLDVSNLLKPALARGELKTIAATTWSEYKKYFEKDAALSRRFQLVKLEPPSVNDAIVIMRGLRATYEEAHKVLIEEDALISVVELSERYLSGRQLPDKAIDVLDTACARVSINLTSPPKLISELSNNRHKIEMEVALLDRELLLGLSQNKDRLSELKKELKKIDKTETKLRKDWLKQQEIVRQIVELRRSLLEKASSNSEINKEDKNNSLSSEENKQIAKLTSLSRELERLQKTQVLVSPHVTQKQIATVIAEWTGVPLDKLSQNELNVGN